MTGEFRGELIFIIPIATFPLCVNRVIVIVPLLRPLLLATSTTAWLVPDLEMLNDPTVTLTVELTVAFRPGMSFAATDERNTPVDMPLDATGNRTNGRFVNITKFIPLLGTQLTNPETTTPEPLNCDGVILAVTTEPDMLSMNTVLIL